MKITDLKCAVLGRQPIVRIVTDEGISGLAQVEYTKPYLKPYVLHLREALLGEDPTNVERVMLKIRQRGAFKPYGAAVSVIETALWDSPARPRACRSTSCSAARCATGCASTTARYARRGRRHGGGLCRRRQRMMERPEDFFIVKQADRVPLPDETRSRISLRRAVSRHSTAA